MAYTQEYIQLSESVVKYNLINFLNLLIDMGSLDITWNHERLLFAHALLFSFVAFVFAAVFGE